MTNMSRIDEMIKMLVDAKWLTRFNVAACKVAQEIVFQDPNILFPGINESRDIDIAEVLRQIDRNSPILNDENIVFWQSFATNVLTMSDILSITATDEHLLQSIRVYAKALLPAFVIPGE